MILQVIGAGTFSQWAGLLSGGQVVVGRPGEHTVLTIGHLPYRLCDQSENVVLCMYVSMAPSSIFVYLSLVLTSSRIMENVNKDI